MIRPKGSHAFAALLACAGCASTEARDAGGDAPSDVANAYLKALSQGDIDEALVHVREDDRELERLAWSGDVPLAPEEVVAVEAVEELAVVRLRVRGPDPATLLDCVLERSSVRDVEQVIESCLEQLPSAERSARVVLTREGSQWRVLSVNALTRRTLVLLERLESTTDVTEHRELERQLRALKDRLAFVAGPSDPGMDRALEHRIADPVGALARSEATPEPAPKTELVDRIKKVGDAHFRIDLRELDPPSLEYFQRSARFVPARSGDRVEGIRLTAIRPNSVYERLAFQNGDVVTELNEQPLNNAEAAIQVWDEIQGASTLNFSVQRSGNRFKLVIELVR